MAKRGQRSERNSDEARETQEVITADRHLQAALKYLAAAREQLAAAQLQVTELQERVASSAREQTPTPPLAISVGEAAKALGVNHTSLYRLLMRGELGSVKVGRRRIVPVSALQAFLERGLEDEF